MGSLGLQAGVSVSKQYFKKAVDRNRIKRLMREAWRLQKPSLSELVESKKLNVSVFILYRGNELPEYAFISSKMLKVIDQLSAIIHEKTTDHI
ncbi:MAG: ribonuclease P protein component [Chitinophagaceae bacterium]